MSSQVLDKTIENGKFVMERRRKVTFGVRDLDQIQVKTYDLLLHQKVEIV